MEDFEFRGRKWRMMYTEQDLVRIARRENNNKRKYLVVNRLQGKHIPVRPHEALSMFCALADTLKGKYENETLLVIGFAETATAVGAAVAAELGADYMQTTREAVPGVSYLYFSEEHSHATEQKLVKDDIDRVINRIDRIIFVEDEVTTGKTILNSIAILQNQYTKPIKFSVASILNGMDKTALETYQKHDIELFWLVKTEHATYAETAEAYKGDGSYIVCKNDIEPENRSTVQNASESDMPVTNQTGSKRLQKDESEDGPHGIGQMHNMEHIHSAEHRCGTEGINHTEQRCSIENISHTERRCSIEKTGQIECIKINQHMDARRIVNAAEYIKYCESLYQDIARQMELDSVQNLLVLGTEEYMYPALYTADRFEGQGKNVRFHATTRSPVAVSTENDYPLHTRYELRSLYDSNRTTYIYDLQKYDTVVIITDAEGDIGEGLSSLDRALKLCGNGHIVLVH